MSKERHVLIFVGKHLSLRGREVKVAVLTLILGGSGTGQAQLSFGKNLILRSLSWTDRARSTQNSNQSWAWSAGKTHRQYREAKEANVICLVF